MGSKQCILVGGNIIKMKGDTMCSLMDITGDKLKEIVKEKSKDKLFGTWSWSIEILEKHIIYNEYVRPSSLKKALDRVKRGQSQLS